MTKLQTNIQRTSCTLRLLVQGWYPSHIKKRCTSLCLPTADTWKFLLLGNVSSEIPLTITKITAGNGVINFITSSNLIRKSIHFWPINPEFLTDSHAFAYFVLSEHLWSISRIHVAVPKGGINFSTTPALIVTNKEICLVRAVFIYCVKCYIICSLGYRLKKKTFFPRNWICCKYAFITSPSFMTY